MALTQEERLTISEKVVSIPSENKTAQDLVSKIEAQKAEVQKRDNTNKSFIDNLKPLVDGYQEEVGLIDGDVRTTLTEQDMLDSADKKLNSLFFPNNTQRPIPSASDGVWKNFQSFAGSAAVGKDYDEAYGSQENELDKLSEILNIINLVEVESDVTRVTGEECVTVGMTDTVQPSATMQGYMTDIKAKVTELKSILNNESSSIITNDSDATRQTANDAAKNDIANVILPAISTWESAPDFDPVGGSSCSTFNSTDISTLDDTKFKPSVLTLFKSSLITRQAFANNRQNEVEGFLGSVSQSADGTIASATGLYGERYRFIELRLNLMTGTLSKLRGLQQAEKAQGQIQSSNDNAEAAYQAVLKVSILEAPSTGTDVLSLEDASGFSVKDIVYVAASGKQELRSSIKSITGNRLKLADKIPVGYRRDNLGRVYKDLT